MTSGICGRVPTETYGAGRFEARPVEGGDRLVDRRGDPTTVSRPSVRLVNSRRVGLMPVARMKQK